MILFDGNNWASKQAAPCFTGRCPATSTLSGGLHCCSLCQKQMAFNHLVAIKKTRPNFYFPSKTHSVEGSAVLTLWPPAHLCSTSPPSVLLLGWSSRLRESHFPSYFLCFFLLTDFCELLLNATVLYVKGTHTHLPCCLFLASGKPDGFLVRLNLHFNQASGQSNFCQSD